MGLLDLPPEILDYILDYAGPTGLPALVLSCRAVYVRARAQIAEHNAMRRRWRSVQHGPAQDDERGAAHTDALALLHAIAKKPVVAEYVEALGLWDRWQGADEDWEAARAFGADAGAVRYLRGALEGAGWSERETGVMEEWWASFGGERRKSRWWEGMGDERRAVGIQALDALYGTMALLALLPNLRTLQLPDGWHAVRRHEAAEVLVPLVDRLVAVANDKSQNRGRALQALETIMPFSEEGYDIRVGLECLHPFMVLDSIRNLYAVSCVAVEEDWGGISFHWPYAVDSPLTRIELASCCMDARGLEVLIMHTPAVTTFKYSHQTKWDGLQVDWNPGEFLQMLADYLGKTLLDLAITVDELHGEIVNGLSSFHSFTALQRLEVDVLPFCGPPLESGQRLGRDAFTPAGATAWTHSDIPCLGDMLPASIREMHLNTDYPMPAEQALKSLVKNIIDRRSNKLRNLDRCVIRQFRSNTAQDIADRHEVVLEVFDMDVQDPRARAMMPLWKREFDEKVGGIVTELDETRWM